MQLVANGQHYNLQMQSTIINAPEHNNKQYLFTRPDAATFELVDVTLAAVHEATNQLVITEDDSCHFAYELTTLVFSYICTMLNQAGNYIAFSWLLLSTVLYL